MKITVSRNKREGYYAGKLVRAWSEEFNLGCCVRYCLSSEAVYQVTQNTSESANINFKGFQGYW